MKRCAVKEYHRWKGQWLWHNIPLRGANGSPGEGNGNPLQYSCLENSVDRGAWGAVLHGVAELEVTENA